MITSKFSQNQQTGTGLDVKYSPVKQTQTDILAKPVFEEKQKVVVTDKISPKLQEDKPKMTWSGPLTPAEPFSVAYIEYNTAVLISNLSKEFCAWKDNIETDTLLFISNIKHFLDDYSKYLYLKSENRILISLLYLIFKNDMWKTLSKSQLDLIIREMDRFKDGQVTTDDLDTFSQQLYRSKIGILTIQDGQEAKEA